MRSDGRLCEERDDRDVKYPVESLARVHGTCHAASSTSARYILRVSAPRSASAITVSR
jgi:hypothetical protein